MKKLLTVCALGALSLSVYAQGLVSLQTTSFNFSTNATAAGGTTGKLGSTANSYYFELLTLADPSGSTTLPTVTASGLSAWTDTGVSGTNYTGLNSGKINAIAASPGVAVSGWAAGATNFIVVVGWSANEGSSWAQVSGQAESGTWNVVGYNSAFGMSSVGYLAAGISTPPAAQIFGANPGQLGAFTLNAIVPEPGTIALAAIGGASLLMFRRKK